MKKNKAIGVVVAIALFLGLLTYTTAVGFRTYRNGELPKTSHLVWTCPAV